MDEKKRERLRVNAENFLKRERQYRTTADTYVANENVENGRRTITTTVLHELECIGVGHAIKAPGDLWEAEVAALLSRGRAYQMLGKRMVERGLAISKDMDGIQEHVGKTISEFLPILKGKLQPKRTTELWKAFHEARLNDALAAGKVIKCLHCGDFFGIKGKLSKRIPILMPEGLKKRWARQHQCPHCHQWCDNPNDLALADKITKEHEETLAVKRELDLKCNACGACDAKGCPGWWKDPCDEAKAVLVEKAPHLLVPPEQRHGPEPAEADEGGWRCPGCGDWFPKPAPVACTGGIAAHAGPQDWSKEELIKAGYPHPEKGYGDWPEWYIKE